jgi:hypothetical protein
MFLRVIGWQSELLPAVIFLKVSQVIPQKLVERCRHFSQQPNSRGAVGADCWQASENFGAVGVRLPILHKFTLVLQGWRVTSSLFVFSR